MKSARKYVLLGLAVALLAALLSGCSVTPAPRYGEVKICVREDSAISGWVYIDGYDEYEYIDGWNGPYCTDWIYMTLDEEHRLEIRGSRVWRDWFTPTRDRQKITVYTPDGETLTIEYSY
mgnify:FL=1